MTRPAALILRALATLVVATAAWVCLGFLATAPLGAIYGWSGHPSIPAAPEAVYIGVYLVALPAVCLLGAFALVRWMATTMRRRHSGSAKT